MANRLTRKNDINYFNDHIRCREYNDYTQFIKDRPYRIDFLSIEVETKLGQIEDLEQELGISVIQLLKDFKKTRKALEEYQNDIDANFLAYTIVNGVTYNNLSEEFGCPTEVVFKALKNKYLYVLYANTKQRIKFLNPRLLYINNQWIIRANYAGFATNIIVKDYKKTWWLEEEKDE